MEVCIDIEEGLLGDFDRAARVQKITRNAAIRAAITDWLSQARRDAVVFELFDLELEVCEADPLGSSSRLPLLKFDSADFSEISIP